MLLSKKSLPSISWKQILLKTLKHVIRTTITHLCAREKIPKNYSPHLFLENWYRSNNRQLSNNQWTLIDPVFRYFLKSMFIHLKFRVSKYTFFFPSFSCSTSLTQNHKSEIKTLEESSLTKSKSLSVQRHISKKEIICNVAIVFQDDHCTTTYQLKEWWKKQRKSY